MMRNKKNKIRILLFSLPALIFIWYYSYHFNINIETPKYILEDSDKLTKQTINVKTIIYKIFSNVPKEEDLLLNEYLDYNNNYFANLRNPFISNYSQRELNSKKYAIKKNNNHQTTKNVKKSNKSIPKKPKITAADFKLMGIIYDETNPSAIINNNVYHEEDIIKNCRIVKITNNGVTLQSGKEQIFLPEPQSNNYK